jgi:type I restriction enzyme S subunit
MFTDLKPYPEYADSGITWLGQLPAHWHVNRLGQIGTFLKGSGGSREDDMAAGVPCVRYGDVYKYHNAFVLRAHSFVSEEQSAGYTRLRRGDLLFALSGESQAEIGKSAVNLLIGRAVCGGDLAIFRANAPIDSRFLGYVADAYPSVAQKSRMGRGDIVVHVSAGRLKRLCIGLPSIDEQAAIVKYLGHANARIDGAIAAKRKLIALLEEQKQAVINQSVTHGLDPVVPMKDSGIPWLGPIPVHWNVRRAKYLFRDIDARSETGLEEQLSVSHLTGVTPRRLKNITMFKAASYVGHKTCRAGDLVVNTMWAWMGALGCAREAGLVSPAYNVYRPLQGSGADAEFVGALFRTPIYIAYFRSNSTGVRASRLRFYPDELLATPVVLPPRDEQAAIVLAIEDLRGRVSTDLEKVVREIELLREFRTRLTADVVTGQFDIRDAVSRLPELDPADLVSDVIEQDEDDLEAELAASLEEVDA